VLVVRVHPQFLDAQHLPDACISDGIWKERFEALDTRLHRTVAIKGLLDHRLLSY
jgi:hypothetical protein